jgi:hypothetical protein
MSTPNVLQLFEGTGSGMPLSFEPQAVTLTVTPGLEG